MPHYALLMKLTEKGAAAIKEAPQRMEAGIKAFESMGGKVEGFYVLMGEYDYLAVGEAPSDEVAMAFAMGLSALGNVKTTTLKAYTQQEATQIIQKLP